MSHWKDCGPYLEVVVLNIACIDKVDVRLGLGVLPSMFKSNYIERLLNFEGTDT